jgi:phage tail-like protein
MIAVFVALEIDGRNTAFSSLTLSTEVEPLFEGNGESDPPQARRIRPRVSLARRHDNDLNVFAWHQSIVEGQIEAARKNCTLTVFDAEGRPEGRYRLTMAWPIKVEVGPGHVGAEEALIESVTLMCDDVRRVTP